MRTRLATVMVATLLALGLMATSALADNPHFIGTPTATVDDTTITVNFKAAGLGTGDYADFSLTGTVDLFSRCYNKGGNKPQADNKQETITVDEDGSFPVRGGQTTGEFVISAESTLDCPGNQIVVVEEFSYDLTLTGPGGITATLSG